MSDQSRTNDIARGAALGGGTGAAAGALATLFQKNKSVRQAVKNALMGGLSGAALGGGVAAISGDTVEKAPTADRKEPSAPVPSSQEKKPHMNELAAALSGYAPGLGPAIHGGIAGGAGQAAKSGLSSLGGAGLGLVLAKVLAGKSKHAPDAKMLSSLAGSGLGSWLAAKGFNDQAKQANVLEKIRPSDESLRNVSFKPFSTGQGLALGAGGGAALGGVTGLLKALLDREDDTIGSSLDKAITGAAYGGLGGAALGGGLSTLARNNMIDKIMSNPKLPEGFDSPARRQTTGDILRHYSIPGKTLADILTGKHVTKGDFDRASERHAARDAVLDVAAPSLVNRFITRDPSTARAY